MLNTSSDDEYSQVLPEFVACGSDKRSDSNDAFERRLLVSERKVRNSFASKVLTVRLPMA